MRQLFLWSLVIIATTAAVGCGDSGTPSILSAPATTHGFVEFAHGQDGDRTYVVGGTPEGFDRVKDSLRETLESHDWQVNRLANADAERYGLAAESPDGRLCVAYWDLKAGGEHLRALYNKVESAHPEAIDRFNDYPTIVFASYGDCV